MVTTSRPHANKEVEKAFKETVANAVRSASVTAHTGVVAEKDLAELRVAMSAHIQAAAAIDQRIQLMVQQVREDDARKRRGE